ncbi:peptidyl-tRNA hydrolase [Syntrophobotulus glycolicus DSM 8271]|uniref:Peptidyl-tRNA hydrolase n=1 Tax=Syntrophobotulus glycolicus (strain DSM 8271 / FlGlyR) TaxID=645991 RepID=F0SW82_SYNGF|nr:aminoacyl-tRNA hydrolase [Syntrophobotulus glycolicus]ADY54568.1 peptidyl-tRNA hydrolase [Syntrophobotulus glycolicus DSM 8271]
MKAVIGLGNPGIKYADTRHNVGFMLLDRIAGNEDVQYSKGFKGKFAEIRHQNRKIILLKPYTFMNLSGQSVAELINYYKVPLEDMLVIHDDMDIALGRLRFREKGSAGGHNGIKSIIQELGTQEFWRLKIGVGRPQKERDVVSHVLSGFDRESREVLSETLEKARKAVFLWLEGKEAEAMQNYNS